MCSTAVNDIGLYFPYFFTEITFFTSFVVRGTFFLEMLHVKCVCVCTFMIFPVHMFPDFIDAVFLFIINLNFLSRLNILLNNSLEKEKNWKIS